MLSFNINATKKYKYINAQSHRVSVYGFRKFIQIYIEQSALTHLTTTFSKWRYSNESDTQREKIYISTIFLLFQCIKSITLCHLIQSS